MEREELEEMAAKKRILLLKGEIDREIVDNLRARLLFFNLQSEEEEIRLIIDSEGGSVELGLFLYDAILHSKAPVVGIVNGRCESTASIVLQACSKRLATRNSRFLFHFVRIRMSIPCDDDFETVLQMKAQEAQKAQRRFEEILGKRTGKSIAEIRELMKVGEKEELKDAEEAKKLGLIDEVIGEEYKIP